MNRKIIMRTIVSLVVLFAILKWTGVIRVEIPDKLYYVIAIIGCLELSAFLFIGIKLYRAKSAARKERMAGIKENER
jgi:hypothetical protein